MAAKCALPPLDRVGAVESQHRVSRSRLRKLPAPDKIAQSLRPSRKARDERVGDYGGAPVVDVRLVLPGRPDAAGLQLAAQRFKPREGRLKCGIARGKRGTIRPAQELDVFAVDAEASGREQRLVLARCDQSLARPDRRPEVGPAPVGQERELKVELHSGGGCDEAAAAKCLIV